MLKIKKPTQMSKAKPPVYCKRYLPLLSGSVMMLYSQGGVGKSFAAIREAVEFAIETGKRTVLWLTEDHEGENSDRYERVIREYDQPREYFDGLIEFIENSPHKLTEQRDGNAILTNDFWQIRLDLFDYSLVVLDPLLQFAGGDENSNTHAGVLMGALKDWAAEEGKTILLLHHATRVNGHNGASHLKPRGASEFVNATRGVYEISRCVRPDGKQDETKGDYRVFTLTKDNGISEHFRDPFTGELSKELKVFPPRYQRVEEQPVPVGYVRMSVANHNDERNPKGFDTVQVRFDEIHLVPMTGHAYSPYLFANGHRKNENNLGFADILCLDFDGGMSLAEAKEKFSGVKCCLVTTRSHLKPGKGERFRVFLKLKTPLCIPSYDHNDFMSVLFEYIGAADPSVKDMARFFFASPEDATYHYTSGALEFDWEPIYRKIKRQKVFEEINKRRTGRNFTDYANVTRGEQDNTLPKDTQFTGRRGEGYTFAQLRDSLSIGDKVIVQCRNGHGHNGGKGPKYNAAAFVGKANNGNVFYHCSGGKCISDGALWCED